MEQLMFDLNTINDDVKVYLLNLISQNRQPSGRELLNEVENKFGWKVRWSICSIIKDLIQNNVLNGIER